MNPSDNAPSSPSSYCLANLNYQLTDIQIQTLWMLDYIVKNLKSEEIKNLLIDFLNNPEPNYKKLMLKISPDKMQNILDGKYFDEIYPKIAIKFDLANFNEFLVELTKTINQLNDVSNTNNKMLRSVYLQVIHANPSNELSINFQKVFSEVKERKIILQNKLNSQSSPSPEVIFSNLKRPEFKVEEAQHLNIKGIVGY